MLTGIKPNKTILRFPDGSTYANLPITNTGSGASGNALRRRLCRQWGIPYYSAATEKPFLDIGAHFIPGFSLRYVYFLNPEARARLTAPVLPYSVIDEMGAGMYKGQSRAKEQEPGKPAGTGRRDSDPHAPNSAIGN